MKALVQFTPLLGLLFLCIINLTGCKERADLPPVKDVNDIYLDGEAVRSLFEKGDYGNSLKEKFNDSLEINWKPDWESLTGEKTNDTTYFSYIPLVPELINVKTNKVDPEAKFMGYLKYIILRSMPENQHTFYIGTYISSNQDGSINLSEFTGSVLLKNLDNGEVSYIKYVGGKVVR